MPNRLVRRVLITPLALAAFVLALVSIPVWVFVGLWGFRFVPGRWRVLRLAWFALVYLMVEAIALMAMFVLWVASGFGWKLREPWCQRAHLRLMRFGLSVIRGSAARVLHIRVRVTDPDGDDPAIRVSDRPLLVLARHAGPMDSFLVVDTVLNHLHHEPRVVMKREMQFDPMLDVLLNRLTNRFITNRGPGATAAVGAISDLAAGLQYNSALVIFPEGGNVTPERKARAVQRLRDEGFEREAVTAEGMAHLMAPRPRGVLAALEACPEADVVLCGHHGLEELSTIGDLWRGLVLDTDVVFNLFHVPREEVPEGNEERIDWLFSQWVRLDQWVGGR